MVFELFPKQVEYLINSLFEKNVNFPVKANISDFNILMAEFIMKKFVCKYNRKNIQQFIKIQLVGEIIYRLQFPCVTTRLFKYAKNANIVQKSKSNQSIFCFCYRKQNSIQTLTRYRNKPIAINNKTRNPKKINSATR